MHQPQGDCCNEKRSANQTARDGREYPRRQQPVRETPAHGKRLPTTQVSRRRTNTTTNVGKATQVKQRSRESFHPPSALLRYGCRVRSHVLRRSAVARRGPPSHMVVEVNLLLVLLLMLLMMQTVLHAVHEIGEELVVLFFLQMNVFGN